MDGAVRAVLGVSYDVAGVAGTDARLAAIAESLDGIIPSDHSAWSELDAAGGPARVVARYGPERPEIVEAVTATADRHPMVLHLRAHPDAVRPLRMSDLVPLSRWLEHEVYREVFRLRGTIHQLTIPLGVTRMRGWAFNRAVSDFSDETMELARLVQPLLAAVERFEPTEARQATAVAERGGHLTAREAEILDLISSGLTTTQIAYVIRVSPRTVSKHVEHLYGKLGVHDRVSAALVGARL